MEDGGGGGDEREHKWVMSAGAGVMERWSKTHRAGVGAEVKVKSSQVEVNEE